MSIRFVLHKFRDYAVSLTVFLAIDMVWLTLIAKPIYSKYLGYIKAPKVNFTAAFVFYALFIIGMLVFVINPALSKKSAKSALFYGIFFGVITYATYDLTNLATIKDWPILITVVDIAWGGFLGGITAMLSYLIINRLNRLSKTVSSTKDMSLK